MTALSALLDDRFAAVGADARRLTPARCAIAVALTVVAGVSVGWIAALLWASAIAVSEVWTMVATGLMARRPKRVRARYPYFWNTACGTFIWSSFGLMLWSQPSVVCHVAAIAYWAGQLLYAQNFAVKSPLALVLIGTPTVLAPLTIPLLIPRFAGGDQLLLMAMIALCIGHAVNATIVNVQAARSLAAATAATTLAKEEAEAASLAKTAFLATMSHEIRTPLNGVLGMTQAMAMEPLSDEQRERLDVVRKSGEALLAILNDVLDLSKIEAGKLAIETIDFDLADVVHGASQAYTTLAKTKGLGFSLDIAGAEGTYRGDPTRIRQILYNLISNALKFTDEGEIRVRAERTPSDGLRLTVADTGEGIAPDKLASLFAKFTQADASTTRRYGGTGLGLSICRELAALMGGSVDAESRPGVGSTFTVTLATPRVGPARPTPVLPSPDTPVARVDSERPQLRLLAAEDNAVNQLVLKTLLRHVSVEPVIVENGALAVEAWENGEWDVILMDVQMPIMGGPEAARAIREREARLGRRRTPILALTANAMAHQVAEYLQAGMDGHIAKPIEAATLFATLQAALSDADDEPDAEAARVA